MPADSFASHGLARRPAVEPSQRGIARRPPLRVAVVGGPDVDARIELMRHVASSFQVSAFGSNPTLAERFSAAGFDYHCYPLSRRVNVFRDLAGMLRLVRAFKHTRPDIVHTFATKPSVWGRLAARVARVPVIIGTLPGLGALYANNDLRTKMLRSAYEPLQKLACSASDLTFFQNPDDIKQFIELGVVTQENAGVIPGSGISTETLAPDRVSDEQRAALRKELGLESGTILVTMISRVNRAKGVIDFLTAAREIRSRHPATRFLLVGPRDEGVHRLRKDELDLLRQDLLWLGPRKDISALLAVTDVFVLPSASREGIPRVLLEAASMELPLVATDRPGCREVVANGVNGFLVPVQDPAALAGAIERLIEHPTLRRRFGEESRRRAKRFDISVIARITVENYRRLLSRKNIRAA